MTEKREQAIAIKDAGQVYRKYFEPDYRGEPSPEVAIGVEEPIDEENPEQWRREKHQQIIEGINRAFRPLVCYEPMMTVETQEFQVQRDGYEIPVRIYRPSTKKPCPILVFYHGGAWLMNSIDVYDLVTRYFARYGNFLVAAVEYRLAPEHPFPVGIEDSYAALCWVAEHAGELGGDASRICVGGDSSGGNFAAVMCLMARDRKGPSLRSQLLIYPGTILSQGPRPMSELRYGNGDYFIAHDRSVRPHPLYLQDPADDTSPYASPLLDEDSSGLPAACFVSAECDPLLDQALMYAAKLEDAGVKVEYHLYRGMIHGFLNHPYQKTFEAMQAMIDFVWAN